MFEGTGDGDGDLDNFADVLAEHGHGESCERLGDDSTDLLDPLRKWKVPKSFFLT